MTGVQGLMERLYDVYTPAGYEYAAQAGLDFLGQYADASRSDTLSNLIFERSGAGKKIAVCAPMDSASFTVHYVAREAGIAHLYTDLTGLEELEGHPLAFDNGESRPLCVKEGKAYVECERLEAYKQGTAALLGKRLQPQPGGILEGVDIGSAAAMGALAAVMMAPPACAAQLAFVFAGRNRLSRQPHAGPLHALWNLDPDVVIWLDVVHCPGLDGAVSLEAATRHYRVTPSLRREIDQALTEAAVPAQWGLCLHDHAPRLMAEHLGVEVVAVGIPLAGGILGQQVDQRHLRQASEVVRAVVAAADGWERNRT